MDPGKNHFSGKVYTRRTKKMSVSLATTIGITSPETSKVSKSKKVPPRTQDLLIANSASSGVVPDGCGGAGVVDGGDGGGGVSQPSGNDKVATVISRVEDRVRIKLTGSVPIVASKNLKSRLEGELDHVKSFVKKVEAKEKLRSLVFVRACEKISSSPLVRPPSVADIANDNPTVIGGVVERGKRIRKENKYYNNSEFLLAKDKLPYERPYGSSKKSKNNKKEKKPSVSPQFIGIPVPKKPRSKDLKNKREMTKEETRKLTEDLENLPSKSPPPVSPQFIGIPVPKKPRSKDLKNKREMTKEETRKLTEDLENLPSKSPPPVSPQFSGIPLPEKPRSKDLKNKREMTNEEIRKLTEDLENLPSENPPPFVRIAMKRGIEKIDTETLWEMDRFVKNYNKSSKRKAEVAQNAAIISSGSMVAAALKASGTGEMHTSASSTHADNARSCNSD